VLASSREQALRSEGKKALINSLQVIRAVKRYNESAKIEADILMDINNKGGANQGIVMLKQYFYHKDKDGSHMCLVFETLGKSLYDFIKGNKYKGMKL
jgi:dual-specificity kinase